MLIGNLKTGVGEFRWAGVHSHACPVPILGVTPRRARGREVLAASGVRARIGFATSDQPRGDAGRAAIVELPIDHALTGQGQDPGRLTRVNGCAFRPPVVRRGTVTGSPLRGD
jgi:hypothetical protein